MIVIYVSVFIEYFDARYILDNIILMFVSCGVMVMREWTVICCCIGIGCGGSDLGGCIIFGG